MQKKTEQFYYDVKIMLRNMYNINLLMYSYFQGHNYTIIIENHNHFSKSASINYNWQ